jgi:cytoskeleton protein RodZ
MDGSGTGELNHEGGQYSFRVGDELRGERVTLGKSLLDVQRDLRIKASFIAAIEDCDATAFPNPGVVPGFVRCYARYLQLDPDEVYRRFCDDSGFAGTQRVPVPEDRSRKTQPRHAAGTAADMRMDFPLAQKPRRELPGLPLAAIGSIFVLAGLIVGLGYGGWSVLQNIQRVQFAPVEEIPIALAEVAPLEAPEPVAGPALPDFAVPVAATSLAELYRQQELEVPILQPRDGPIAAIDPDRIGMLARRNARSGPSLVAATEDLSRFGVVRDAAMGQEDIVTIEGESLAESELPTLVSLEPEGPPRIVVIAERPAWIRVYLRNGTVIFERILETGEVYAVPETDEAPLIWAGNSGSVYVRIGETLHGPIGSGTRAARDVPLDPATITERFEIVADVPGVIADTIGAMGQPNGVLVQ